MCRFPGHNFTAATFYCASDMIDVWFECVQVCCVYTGMMFEVKIAADSNDITECLRDDKPTIGMFGYSLHLM